ncbi:MAG: hypothetical protein JSR66_09725 [Proteobacteria bacterium]|nr:hypothetical protein [Pseudomonadota bacterium]
MSTPVWDRYGSRWPVMALGWVAILSAIVFVDHARWRHLASEVHTSTPASGAVAALDNRVTALETQMAALKRQPTTAIESAARFAAASKALEDRLTHLEQGGTEGAAKTDLELLARRLSVLESARAQAAHSASASVTAPHAARSPSATRAPTDPPFQLVGLELRGGETFLAIAPSKAVSLAEMSVLRVGDVQDGWQLEALDSKSATFRFQGQPHRLELP